jgi:TonB family protein
MELKRLPQQRRKREEVPSGAAGYALSLIIALAFHGAFLIVLAGIVVSMPTQTVREIGIDVSIRPSAVSGTPGPASVASLPAGPIMAAGPKVAARPPVSTDSEPGVEVKEDPSSLRSVEAMSPVLPGDARIDESSVGQPQPGEGIGWEGSARKLLRKRDPAFPAQLSAAGQEVECEARITVASSGVVTRVEITTSSGYIEIDASVEAALHDYLFSRASERKDTVGTIRFRFRLERQD